jgi:hypothetical protein
VTLTGISLWALGHHHLIDRGSPGTARPSPDVYSVANRPTAAARAGAQEALWRRLSSRLMRGAESLASPGRACQGPCPHHALPQGAWSQQQRAPWPSQKATGLNAIGTQPCGLPLNRRPADIPVAPLQDDQRSQRGRVERVRLRRRVRPFSAGTHPGRRQRGEEDRLIE